MASLVAVLGLNYFFLEPVGTFTIDVRASKHTDIVVSQPMSGVISPEGKPLWFWQYALDETLARVTALGGEILVAARPAAYESRFAIIADPTGGALGLVEYVENANPATRP